jgi:O-antigen ligase
MLQTKSVPLGSSRKWVVSRSVAIEILFALVCIASAQILAKAGVQSPTWLLIYAIVMLWCLRSWSETLRAVQVYWLLFLPPTYALLSMVWSWVPGYTLGASIQYLISTLIAVRLAISMDPLRALKIVAVVLFGALLLSLANAAVGFLPPAWEHNGALLGIFKQKNVMGKAAVLALVYVVVVLKIKRVPLVGILIYICGFPILQATQSAGALLTYLCMGLMFPLFALRFMSAQMRVLLLLLPVVAIVLFGAAMLVTGFDPFSALLSATGKSATLTGRTVIWWFGIQTFLENPILGVGYKAYWVVDSYAISFIHNYIDDGLYWFHNIYIDLLVSGGILGLACSMALLAACVRQALRWYSRTGSLVATGWGLILIFNIVAGIGDNVAFTQHDFSHIMMLMGYIFAHRALTWPQKPTE